MPNQKDNTHNNRFNPEQYKIAYLRYWSKQNRLIQRQISLFLLGKDKIGIRASYSTVYCGRLTYVR
jgi:hypothetical protein